MLLCYCCCGGCCSCPSVDWSPSRLMLCACVVPGQVARLHHTLEEHVHANTQLLAENSQRQVSGGRLWRAVPVVGGGGSGKVSVTSRGVRTMQLLGRPEHSTPLPV